MNLLRKAVSVAPGITEQAGQGMLPGVDGEGVEVSTGRFWGMAGSGRMEVQSVSQVKP